MKSLKLIKSLIILFCLLFLSQSQGRSIDIDTDITDFGSGNISIKEMRRNMRRRMSGMRRNFRRQYRGHFTPREEYYIGRTISAWLLSKYEAYQDGERGESDLEIYINSIGRTLAMASNRPETFKGYRFIILDSESINAYAVPGGMIFITMGLLDKVENEDELAGVLAHEVAHIELGHPTRAIARARRQGMIDSIVGEDEDTEANAAFKALLKDVRKNVLRGFNRKQEKQADLRAVDILIKAGYSPHGLSKVLRRLKNGGGVHGNPRLRARDVDRKIAEKSHVPELNEKRTERFEDHFYEDDDADDYGDDDGGGGYFD